MTKLHRVFIYGTLKKGFYFHEEYLGGDKSKFIGKAVCSPDYSLYVDGMPHLIEEMTDKPVKGELYEVNDSVLKSLDDLEGTPVIYHRKVIDTYNEAGEKVLAWAYLRPVHFKGKLHAYKEEEFI